MVFYILAISSLMGTMLGHWYILAIGFFIIIAVSVILCKFLNQDELKEDKIISLDLGLNQKLQIKGNDKKDSVDLTPAQQEEMKALNIRILKNSYMDPHQLIIQED